MLNVNKCIQNAQFVNSTNRFKQYRRINYVVTHISGKTKLKIQLRNYFEYGIYNIFINWNCFIKIMIKLFKQSFYLHFHDLITIT